MGVPPDLDVKPQIVARERRPKRRASRWPLEQRRHDAPRRARRTPGCRCAGPRRAAHATAARVAAPATASSPGPATRATAARFVAAALAAGAAACLVEAEGVEAFGFDGDARIAALRGLKAATGQIAAAFFDDAQRRSSRSSPSPAPTARPRPRGGLAQALRGARPARAASIGTLGDRARRAAGLDARHRPDHARPGRCCRPRSAASPTTASAPARSRPSSIGIVEQRLAGTRIEVALFTNFTQDHLDYHGSMDAYWAGQGGAVRAGRA